MFAKIKERERGCVLIASVNSMLRNCLDGIINGGVALLNII